jgi:hypothetical protein
MSDPTDNDLIATYIRYRDYVAAQNKAHAERMAPYEAAMEKLAGAMHLRLNERGDESVKTEAGTAYKSTSTSIKVADREAFFNFVRDADAFEMLTAAVAKDAVKAYMEEHQDVLPPGLEQSTFTKVNFRRA